MDWEAIAAELAPVETSRAERELHAGSRDYHWYSPILAEQLDGKRADLIVRPRSEAEVMRVAAVVAKHRAPLTVRGGGTGNYGQCVPLAGGVVIDITGLDRIVEIAPGRMRTQAGALLADCDAAARSDGQQLMMYPSTLAIATIGGFVAGGYAGVGSIRHGILKENGNVSLIRVVTVEDEPRAIELTGADIQKVHHAFGTNGVITELVVRLAPAQEWRHVIATFDHYENCLRFGVAASDPAFDLFLLSAVDARFAEYYPELAQWFSVQRHAMFAMVAPGSIDAFGRCAARFGGTVGFSFSEGELARAGLPPAYECAYNHTTLRALQVDRSWTYLQIAYPQPFDPALAVRQMRRYGDEIYMHHEFAQQFGAYVVFALPLVRFFERQRLYEIIAEFEADGCLVFDPHVYTIEDGGMKEIDQAQLAFKRLADPYGLMNPGKMRAALP